MERPILTREWGFLVAGYVVHTSHSAETDPSRARLPELWARVEGGVLERALPRRMAGGKPFVVYHSYDADQDRCAMLVGYQVRGLEDVPDGIAALNVPPGRYLMFTAQGPQPQSARRAWGEIQAYFRQPRAPRRAYSFDFEVYEHPLRASIFVAIR
ncbi:MAG: GyrI-like domain-containing protein [Meiothermus sp.]|uniref:GyrI-like domain-containing protein n=1 Tax=Meiothermus sp. TaxID=1955249 RepID=UPI0025FC95F9|nr:GyrI-like domain-containing protein [Meiothermus sp.]MCS7057783.1 GyrI-like domain-containing protein [Meiothermus sp.]MCS7194626.1 GyrI-like domain-containing protein [Meiothermus sp.]MCX7740815.1 GyrI-like domain-containing protein [Meiothermus sp.]MDW8090965.1 GyrI-like domain-containing protein [Meiothermus sp.]MDW8481859.1 GyrI-like domain-containing protein [Meiothermus sp.]